LDNPWLIGNSLVIQWFHFENGTASLPNFIADFINTP
jgi:hypothetical protein